MLAAEVGTFVAAAHTGIVAIHQAHVLAEVAARGFVLRLVILGLRFRVFAFLCDFHVEEGGHRPRAAKAPARSSQLATTSVSIPVLVGIRGGRLRGGLATARVYVRQVDGQISAGILMLLALSGRFVGRGRILFGSDDLERSRSYSGTIFGRTVGNIALPRPMSGFIPRLFFSSLCLLVEAAASLAADSEPSVSTPALGRNVVCSPHFSRSQRSVTGRGACEVL